MPNLRIIHDNAIDRATALSASTTAGAYAASRMQSDRKGEAHRSTGTSVTYTATWTAGESIAGVALPASNLTADATIRARGYSDVAGTTLVADTGVLYACPGNTLGLWDWTQPINANAFAYGGYSKSSIWFDDHYFIKRLVIDVVDAANPAGYIDCARLVAGPVWEPENNADYGFEITPFDTTVSTRNDAGDNPSDAGTMHDQLALDVSYMAESDRAELMRIMRRVGTAMNIYVSLLPEHPNPVAEQDHQGFFKRANSPMRGVMYRAYSNKMTLEGW